MARVLADGDAQLLERGRDLILLELSALHPTDEDDGTEAAAFVGATTVGVPSFGARGKQSAAAAANDAPASLVLRDARCPPEEDVAVVDAGRRAQGGGGGGSWSVHNGQLVHSTHLEADSLLREGDRLPDG